jgi:DNA-binding CsgD family transcriptional regulator
MIRGEYSEALLQMAIARQAIISNDDIPPRGRAPLLYAQQVRLYLKLKDFDSAEDMTGEYVSLGFPSTEEGLILQGMFDASIRIEKKEATEDTIAELKKLAGEAAEGKYILTQIEIYLLITRQYYYMKKHNDAIKTLKIAIDLAKRDNIIQLFLDEGEIIRLLLTELIGARALSYDSDRFVRVLVGAFDHANSAKDKNKPHTRWISESEESGNVSFVDHWGLTNREGEVLQLLVQGMNRKEIAKELCTSQNTVKTHISHIYEKMEVHSVSELLRKMMEHEAL